MGPVERIAQRLFPDRLGVSRGWAFLARTVDRLSIRAALFVGFGLIFAIWLVSGYREGHTPLGGVPGVDGSRAGCRSAGGPDRFRGRLVGPGFTPGRHRAQQAAPLRRAVTGRSEQRPYKEWASRALCWPMTIRWCARACAKSWKNNVGILAAAFFRS